VTQIPRLVHSGLTGRIYIATRYKEFPDGSVVSSLKYDVTREFEAIEASREQERQARNEDE